MKTPILETERLTLRPITVADAEEIYTNWASDPEVAKYMTWNTHPCVDVTIGWLTDVEQKLDSDTTYDWGFVRKADGKLIGSGGLYYTEVFGGFIIGYNIMKDCWRQGYTTEASRTMIDYAVKELGAKKFLGQHAIDNPNSGKVMEKVGFKYIKNGYYTKRDGTQVEAKEYILELE